MKTVLFIDGCVRGRQSRTRILADAFIRELSRIRDDIRIETADLNQLALQPLNEFTLREREDASKNFDAPVFDAAKQFKEADLLVIAAPFWEGTFPAALHTYMEHVCCLLYTSCRELMEEGRKTWNFALENYARRLYRQTLDSPLDNLRDLRLVRELESTGAKISDTDKYRTPEVQVNLDRSKTQGAGLSDRYSGVQLGNTRGFLTPFKGGNYENQVNRVGELMHRVDLSRQATAVLDWIRCNIYIDLNDLNGLESSFERLQNSPDLQQKMGISADLGEVYKELTEKKVFRAWQTDYGMMLSLIHI